MKQGTAVTAATAAIHRELEGAGSLATAIQIGLRQTPQWLVVDVVIQDEFTHDVVMQAAPDGPALLLDCT